MSQIKGSCLCGAVTYSCDSEPIFTGVCHCRACQKSTSSAFAVIVGVSTADFHIQGDTLAVYEDTADSGRRIRRHFCSRCGTGLYGDGEAMPDKAFIKAGTLDDTSNLKPQAHFYWSHHQAWIEDLATGMKFDTVPPPRG